MSYCTHCGAELPEDATTCPACRRPLAAWEAKPPPPPPPVGLPGTAAPVAPAPVAAPARRTSAAVKVAIALGCLVLVVFAGGLVAALVIPNFLEAKAKAQHARTMAELRNVGVALESYRADHLGVPAVASFEELAPILAPDYLVSLPPTDGWGHPLRYECTAPGGPTGCAGYRLASPGRDGEYTEAWLADYLPEAFGEGEWDRDVVYGDGLFVQSPDGP